MIELVYFLGFKKIMDHSVVEEDENSQCNLSEFIFLYILFSILWNIRFQIELCVQYSVNVNSNHQIMETDVHIQLILK